MADPPKLLQVTYHNRMASRDGDVITLKLCSLPCKYELAASRFNSHPTDWEKCVEIIKTLHVKFFPFGSPAPYGRVTVKFG